MTTSVATKFDFTVRTTNIVDAFTEFGDKYQALTFTIKGRLDGGNDSRAVFLAASRCDYVSNLKTDGPSAEISWELGCIGRRDVRKDVLAQVQGNVNQFVTELLDIYNNSKTLFKGHYVEPHVFIESLKLLDEFDGVRDGALRGKF